MDQLLAVSYSRASLGQTGSGHFSPAGGYTSENGGMVLILDVARFKYEFSKAPQRIAANTSRRYPSYWVPIRTLYEALIPYDTETNQPRGYCILRRPSKPEPSPALLVLNATTPTWPSLYAPLAEVATSATSYESLISTLAEILRSPSGLPTVTSRYEGAHPSTLAVLSKSPSFDAAEGAKAHTEYRRGVARLYRYFAENSALYKELKTADDLWKTEITVFMLALLSAKDMKERMLVTVKEGIEERLSSDLADETIKTEVENVRRQMESLTECSVEDGICSRPGGCCGKNACS